MPVKQWTTFTVSQWRRLPLAMRQRWWKETEFGAKPPSEALKQLIGKVLQENGTVGTVVELIRAPNVGGQKETSMPTQPNQPGQPTQPNPNPNPNQPKPPDNK
jgi:hypothetical protein